jgi:ABC-type multidrug transport system ATPase subunit
VQVVGYCPQFDALNAYLTGREQLAFYARLRGIAESDVKCVVDWAIRHMHLSAYARHVTRSYSGGNKRKLSAAIAMLGNPLVVLLDEPSTGMDPKTRRFMWDRISDLTRDNHTVLLTTHRYARCSLTPRFTNVYSMEECEALCTRVSMMVNGRMKCMGSIQHIKQKFGEGYRLTLKLRSGTALTVDKQRLEKVVHAVAEHLPAASLVDVHYLTVDFKLDAKRVTLSQGRHMRALYTHVPDTQVLRLYKRCVHCLTLKIMRCNRPVWTTCSSTLHALKMTPTLGMPLTTVWPPPVACCCPNRVTYRA